MKKLIIFLLAMLLLTACNAIGEELSSADNISQIQDISETSEVEQSSEIEPSSTESSQDASLDESTQSQEQSHQASEEPSEEESKEQSKEESKEESKEQSKEQSKEESKEQSKEESKEQSKEESKEESSAPPETSEESYTPMNYSNVKAIWVSQFDTTDIYQNGQMRSQSEFTTLAKRMIANIKETGFNTIILQIRPNGDSFYESQYYPASRYVTGAYGRSISYDALGIFIDEAHKQGLSVQAWINPMRLMTTTEITAISNDNPLKKMYNQGLLAVYSNRLYLDPSRQQSRDLIINGAREALLKYDFDGLHMDDYFYPTTDASFDSAQFAASGYSNLSDFRIANINKMVKGLYEMVKSVDSRLIFGISPAGNLNTLKSVYYADAYEWCSKSGYIDYIMPQIYFGFLHGTCPFAEMVDKWASIVTNSNVKLYIGISLGKAVNGANNIEDQYAVTTAGKREWIENKNVISRSITTVNEHNKTAGYTIFCYQYLFNPVSGSPVLTISAERSLFMPLIKQ